MEQPTIIVKVLYETSVSSVLTVAYRYVARCVRLAWRRRGFLGKISSSKGENSGREMINMPQLEKKTLREMPCINYLTVCGAARDCYKSSKFFFVLDTCEYAITFIPGVR